MKILYVITGMGLGGAEKVVADLADQMHLKGHQLKIVYLTGEVIVRPIHPEIELHGLQLNSLKDLYQASKLFQKIVNEFKPDVVHAHMIHANIFTRLNRTICKIPRLICTAHSSNEGGRLRMMAYRLTNFLSDLNTNVSQQAVNRFIELGAFPKHQALTVYNGINTEHYSPQPFLEVDQVLKSSLFKNKKNILAVGRFNVLKDYPNLLGAIQKLLYELNYDAFHLYIAGDGELRAEIESLIQLLKLDAHVTLLGRRNDIAALLSSADVFTLASSHEGFGLVVAEAMACESYVVATDSGGVAEVMGDTGTLVPTKNSAALAQALFDALNMSSIELEANNQAARRRVVEKFSLDRAVQQWLELYEAH